MHTLYFPFLPHKRTVARDFTHMVFELRKLLRFLLESKDEMFYKLHSSHSQCWWCRYHLCTNWVLLMWFYLHNECCTWGLPCIISAAPEVSPTQWVLDLRCLLHNESMSAIPEVSPTRWVLDLRCLLHNECCTWGVSYTMSAISKVSPTQWVLYLRCLLCT